MIRRLRRAAVSVLYQVALVVGILLLPVALAARRVGVRLPADRALERLGSLYETHRAGRSGP